MGGFVLLPCWMFGLRGPSPGVYNQVNGDLQEALSQGEPSKTAASSAPVPVVCSSWGPPTLADSFGSVSCVSLLLFWVLVLFCFVCDLQDWSLYLPQSCVSLVVKSHWPSRSDSLGIPSPFVGSPAGTPDVGFTTVGKLLVLLFSSLCVTN